MSLSSMFPESTSGCSALSCSCTVPGAEPEAGEKLIAATAIFDNCSSLNFGPAITFTACPLVLFGLIDCSQGTSCVPKRIPKKTSAAPLHTGRKAIQRRNQPRGCRLSRTGGAERSSRVSASSLRHCARRIPAESSSSAGCKRAIITSCNSRSSTTCAEQGIFHGFLGSAKRVADGAQLQALIVLHFKHDALAW